MANLIVILIILYAIYRFSTSYLFPKISERKLNKFKEQFKKDNPDIFKNKTKE